MNRKFFEYMYGVGDIGFLKILKKRKYAVTPYYINFKYGLSTRFIDGQTVYLVRHPGDNLELSAYSLDVSLLDKLLSNNMSKHTYSHEFREFLLGKKIYTINNKDDIINWFKEFKKKSGFYFLPSLKDMRYRISDPLIITDLMIEKSRKIGIPVRLYYSEFFYSIYTYKYRIIVVDGDYVYIKDHDTQGFREEQCYKVKCNKFKNLKREDFEKSSYDEIGYIYRISRYLPDVR